MMRRYARPEQFPYSQDLPVPVLPLQRHHMMLQSNSINMNTTRFGIHMFGQRIRKVYFTSHFFYSYFCRFRTSINS